jgi:hypothetical protein
MYNMDISIFGIKISLEILILIAILYLIIMIHTVCSCCNVNGIIETLTNMDSSNNYTDMSGNKDVSHNFLLNGPREGFTGANTNNGQSSPYDLNYDKPINTSHWMQPNMTVTKGQPLSPGVQAILNRPAQPIPLPEGELLLFANTEFKPECCPNTYSNSSGCACMTAQQYNYLVQRSGNNVPYSEY